MKAAIGFLFFLLFLAAFALVFLQGRQGTGSGDAELEGSRWAVVSLDGSSIAPEAGLTVEFGERGRIFGDGGCNLYSGAYTRDEQGFRVSSLRATRKACEPPVMEREQELFDVLSRTAALRVSDNALTLLDADGNRIGRVEAAPAGQ